ncbi:Cys-tRNA(Pro) deacylase [Ignavibacteria bacterium]|nr:Cys-tRNA(Pro) deacylase [Bacteroidota bacterium]MCZ2132169.1 Cys-tRNA(Pro) deacylase [Bacteroidota bacterium]
MSRNISKTNACRILDARNTAYDIIDYESNDEELDAVSVARKIGLPPEEVFKTLILCGDVLRYFVIVVPGNCEVSLKKVATSTGNKSCNLLPLKELEPLTGYIRGGCSPIGMKKQFPTFIEETALLFERISVSAGRRGQQILIAPNDLAEAVTASFADLL